VAAGGSKMASFVVARFAIAPEPGGAADGAQGTARPTGPLLDEHWVRLGYAVIAVVLLGRLVFLAGDNLELSKDEAYPMAVVQASGAFLL